MPTIHDFTPALRAAEPMLTVHRGLYVQYLVNDSELDVHDRNGESKGGGTLLIPARGRMVKIGKFAHGLLARRAADAVHMHRRVPGERRTPTGDEFLYAPKLGTYLDCLRLLIVLDLGSPSKSEVREAENQLRKKLDEFLVQRCDRVARRRGDFRILLDDPGMRFRADLARWARKTLAAIARTRRVARRTQPAGPRKRATRRPSRVRQAT